VIQHRVKKLKDFEAGSGVVLACVLLHLCACILSQPAAPAHGRARAATSRTSMRKCCNAHAHLLALHPIGQLLFRQRCLVGTEAASRTRLQPATWHLSADSSAPASKLAPALGSDVHKWECMPCMTRSVVDACCHPRLLLFATYCRNSAALAMQAAVQAASRLQCKRSRLPHRCRGQSRQRVDDRARHGWHVLPRVHTKAQSRQRRRLQRRRAAVPAKAWSWAAASSWWRALSLPGTSAGSRCGRMLRRACPASRGMPAACPRCRGCMEQLWRARQVPSNGVG